MYDKQTLKLLEGKHYADIFVNAALYYATTCEYRPQLLHKHKISRNSAIW